MKSKNAALNQSHNFTPVAIGPAGPFRPVTFSFLRELGCRLKQVTGEAKSFFFLQPIRHSAMGKANTPKGGIL